ncbi:RNA-directed DNA polymerase from mobile element jockey [Holothuria leucospilota]|uniref:RNA-directed DNA polymerase from mobile element jockey n=1 Tax=Holothuria leucospilota TaxID=206669 RepID=A0A9Q1CSD3_HOLLE|nr:RNA-directed DNA polymerase from mobile element jockey [Holothuria leucospilota]
MTTSTNLLTTRPGPHRPAQRKNYTKTNWDNYARDLTLAPPPDLPLTNTIDIDNQIQLTTDTIKSALDNNSPNYKPPRAHKDFLLPQPLLQLIRLKNRLRKAYQRTRNLLTKQNINRLTNQIKRQLTNFHANRWADACSKVDTNTSPSERWKIFKRLSGNSQKAPYPTLVTPQTTARTDQEKATLLNQTMDQIQRNHNDPHFNNAHLDHVNNYILTHQHLFNPLPALQPDPPLDPLTSPFQEAEIKLALKKTKNTTPGTDGIPFKALKLAPPALLTHLARLYTACLSLGYFPRPWKIARLTMIPKPGKDHSNPKTTAHSPYLAP